jgi:hypothetical protein
VEGDEGHAAVRGHAPRDRAVGTGRDLRRQEEDLPERDLRCDALPGHLADDPSLSRADARLTKRAAPAALFTSPGRAERRPAALGEQPQPGLVACASACDDDERARTGSQHRNACQEGSDAPALTRRAERTPEALKVTRTASRALNPCPFSIGPTIRSVGVILTAPVASRPHAPAASATSSSSSAVRFTEGVSPDPPAANRPRLTPGRAERATGGADWRTVLDLQALRARAMRAGHDQRSFRATTQKVLLGVDQKVASGGRPEGRVYVTRRPAVAR